MHFSSPRSCSNEFSFGSEFDNVAEAWSVRILSWVYSIVCCIHCFDNSLPAIYSFNRRPQQLDLLYRPRCPPTESLQRNPTKKRSTPPREVKLRLSKCEYLSVERRLIESWDESIIVKIYSGKRNWGHNLLSEASDWLKYWVDDHYYVAERWNREIETTRRDYLQDWGQSRNKAKRAGTIYPRVIIQDLPVEDGLKLSIVSWISGYSHNDITWHLCAVPLVIPIGKGGAPWAITVPTT